MKNNNRNVYPLITQRMLDDRISRLAGEINEHYKNSDNLIVVGLLNGAFMFCSDLTRKLEIPLKVDFICVSSYGNEKESSGIVNMHKDLSLPIRDADVLLVEDIIDTGITLDYVINRLKQRDPKSIEVCALLTKPDRREIGVAARWVGFSIPNVFIVGYGADNAQYDRNMPIVGYVEPKEGDAEIVKQWLKDNF